MANTIPENFHLLHQGEEELRAKALSHLEGSPRLALHLDVTEVAMDMLDVFRQFDTSDEDLKVVQMLGLRLFNALASSVKLTLSGYYQNSALILRDILETVFLIDHFRTDHSAITRWRLVDRKARRKEFQPAKVRDALDRRDGFSGQERGALYALFSELAAHPSMLSVSMLRPKGMDARNGPFFDATAIEAVLSETGRLAIQVGEMIAEFLPAEWPPGIPLRAAFGQRKAEWLAEFYPQPPSSE